jgi:RNA polymerase sigma-70 factor (ECF subfamily)
MKALIMMGKKIEDDSASPRPEGPAGRGDEELAARLAAGDREALAPLYKRYAPLVYHIAAQSLDPASAEDLVQEVFLALWRKAASFDYRRGPFRPWLLQIVHFRVLNELRRKSRRPLLDSDAELDILDGLPYEGDGPAEEAWNEFRAKALRSAVDSLPAAQRQALSLAYFEDLTQDQVAETLHIPYGTAKTRIRAALGRLRAGLAPFVAASLLAVSLAGLLAWSEARQAVARLNERALSFVTASDISTLHLSAAAGLGGETHGSYRGRQGTALAVLALHNFAAAPAGRTYAAWALIGGRWILVGSALPDRNGNALIVGERPELARLPEAVEVRLEPKPLGSTPRGMTIVEWPGALVPARKE